VSSAFDELRQVQFEITNQCNYAAQHPKCPASKVTSPNTLESEIVFKVFDWLGENDYTGEVMFSIYNEPMTDPRLFWFIRELNVRVPKATVYVITNGWNLDQKMLNELHKACRVRVIANGYTPEEQARLGPLSGATLRTGHLDNRIHMYENKSGHEGRVCHAVARNFAVWNTGEVALCCYDWKHSIVFGDLHTQTPDEILDSPERARLVKLTEAGRRSETPVCKGCIRVWSGQ